MPALLAANGLEIVAIALAALVFAGVLWMIFDILTRPDFTGFQKILGPSSRSSSTWRR